MKQLNLYISGFKGFLVLKLCYYNNLKINKVYSYKSELNKKFFLEIKNYCSKNKLHFVDLNPKKIKTHLPSSSNLSFFIGWQYTMKNFNNIYIFHDSLLPSYSGHSPTVNALINGEKKIGISLFIPSKKIDEGKILYQKSYSVKYPIKIEKVYNELTFLIYEVIYNIINKKKLDFKKNKYKKFYSIWRDEEDLNINWHKDKEYIERFVNALDFPYNNARSNYKNKLIKIIDCEIYDKLEFINYHPGKIASINKNKPLIMCKNGLIKINKAVYLTGKAVKFSFLRERLS